MIYTAWRDITERKKAEVRLRESEERYRTAIESSSDGVAIVSEEKHLYVNKKLLDIYGYDRIEEVMEKSPVSMLHPDYRETVAKGIRERQKGHKAPGSYEIKGIRKDGSVIDLESSVATITYQGKPATLSYIRDVTMRKLAEEVLKEREKELEIESRKLEEANTALKVLLRNREEDRKMLEEYDPFQHHGNDFPLSRKTEAESSERKPIDLPGHTPVELRGYCISTASEDWNTLCEPHAHGDSGCQPDEDRQDEQGNCDDSGSIEAHHRHPQE